MKLRSNDFQKQLKNLSEREKQQAFKWINSLSTEKKAKYNQLARIHIANMMIEAYLNQKRIRFKLDPMIKVVKSKNKRNYRK